MNATTASSASCFKSVCMYLTHMWCTQSCRIAIFGLAFLIATITQLQAAFTRNFHYDMKDDLPRWFMWILVVIGTLPPQCHFHLITYNMPQTDLDAASCACEGGLLCLLSNSLCSCHPAIALLPFYHTSAEAGQAFCSSLQSLACLLLTIGLPLDATAQA